MKANHITVIGVVFVFLIAIVAFLNAADCPSGKIAVRNVWGWPICIVGAK